MLTHVPDGYLYYYDDEPTPDPHHTSSLPIWRRTAVMAAWTTAFYTTLATTVVLLGIVGYL
ncbi:hypothetical protein BZB76_0723 [Actinomadura pelletieri DSM 43383]|uniref:Uncharacterized protein n=1 Tax=Actinomadura pelletieri DSM 43383 TaxID=1120940 RepID=A0A495QYJ8_9ACTN|nr:hypothetical protein [Actinomadura pelletieri]RKS79271.1 hypothetical protein BZB76_0723 [Actinomadura pelletieri DSM 43383]